MPREVFLIRTAPGTGAGDRILADARRASAPLCFFHGDGVDQALDPATGQAWSTVAAATGGELMVCETALARRGRAPMPPPWRVGSLARYWAAAAPGPGEGSVLVHVRVSGDARFKREVLELCLAAAALEIELAVVFAASGLDHLRGPDAAGWRQFPDFDLAPLYRIADGETAVDVAVERLTAAEVAALEAAASRVLDV